MDGRSKAPGGSVAAVSMLHARRAAFVAGSLPRFVPPVTTVPAGGPPAEWFDRPPPRQLAASTASPGAMKPPAARPRPLRSPPAAIPPAAHSTLRAEVGQ